jgi:hypothetical protein
MAGELGEVRRAAETRPGAFLEKEGCADSEVMNCELA